MPYAEQARQAEGEGRAGRGNVEMALHLSMQGRANRPEQRRHGKPGEATAGQDASQARGGQDRAGQSMTGRAWQLGRAGGARKASQDIAGQDWAWQRPTYIRTPKLAKFRCKYRFLRPKKVNKEDLGDILTRARI